MSLDSTPSTKVYTQLNIVDEYQIDLSSPTKHDSEEQKHEDSLPMIASYNLAHTLMKIQLLPASFGESQNYSITYRNQSWKTSKSQEEREMFLDKQGVKNEMELAREEPKLETLLFFDFFTQVDHLAGLDAFRALKVSIKSFKIDHAELKIDN